ncbi:putative RNA recognition motif domain, nucleotide-binding alpha-beta plait domain superfamily [Helianthus annuus]|nr:putative RNA recognition motif domain, nucleotide-binding alpha-beta plait domain superfamily [Helianthus annuus]
MADDGPWEDPHHLQKKDKIRNKEKLGSENVTKFFVTNLPLGCTPWEVSEFVKVFGEVAVVYIARKKDKFGNRFCFISFKHVRDVKEMKRALNGTKMGSNKLKVNVARFASENSSLFGNLKEANSHSSAEPQGRIPVQNQFNNHAFISNGGGKLFSDLFVKNDSPKAGVSSGQTSCGKMVEVPEDTLAFQELSGKALVGRCSDLKSLNSLNSALVEAGYSSFSISYLGGLSILVKMSTEEECKNLVGTYDLWQHLFSALDYWMGQSLPF